jgi:hypothetical protein
MFNIHLNFHFENYVNMLVMTHSQLLEGLKSESK